MTMLLSTCTENYVLSTTDMQVSRLSGECYSPINEKFNKHILYTSQSFSCDITYTGVAEWTQNGCTTRLYDIISYCAARCAKDNVTTAELLIALTVMVKQTLDRVSKLGIPQVLELHMVGFHRECPWPFLGCISSSLNKKTVAEIYRNRMALDYIRGGDLSRISRYSRRNGWWYSFRVDFI